jgi:hypothetical protein
MRARPSTRGDPFSLSERLPVQLAAEYYRYDVMLDTVGLNMGGGTPHHEVGAGYKRGIATGRLALPGRARDEGGRHRHRHEQGLALVLQLEKRVGR